MPTIQKVLGLGQNTDINNKLYVICRFRVNLVLKSIQTNHKGIGWEPMKDRSMGKRVALLARAKDVSQTELASRSEVSRVSLNRFFRGQSELRLSDFVQVLQELGIDFEVILKDRLDQAAGKTPEIDSPTLGGDMEVVLNNMTGLGRKSYLGHLVAHAELLDGEVPDEVFFRLQKEMNQ